MAGKPGILSWLWNHKKTVAIVGATAVGGAALTVGRDQIAGQVGDAVKQEALDAAGDEFSNTREGKMLSNFGEMLSKMFKGFMKMMGLGGLMDMFGGDEAGAEAAAVNGGAQASGAAGATIPSTKPAGTAPKRSWVERNLFAPVDKYVVQPFERNVIEPIDRTIVQPVVRWAKGRISESTGHEIAKASATHGVDERHLRTMAMLESGGDHLARSKASGGRYKGLYQLGDPVCAKYGATDPFDVEQNIRGGCMLAIDDSKGFKRIMGREPAGWELYLCHQQGLGGATTLLKHPEMSAADALALAHGGNLELAKKCVTQNGGSLAMTAEGFAHMWEKKYNNMYAVANRTEGHNPQASTPVMAAVVHHDPKPSTAIASTSRTSRPGYAALKHSGDEHPAATLAGETKPASVQLAQANVRKVGKGTPAANADFAQDVG
jgi:hypothetical protein